MLILHNEIVEVVSQVVRTCRASMAVKDAEKADLRPFYVQMGLALWFEYV